MTIDRKGQLMVAATIRPLTDEERNELAGILLGTTPNGPASADTPTSGGTGSTLGEPERGCEKCVGVTVLDGRPMYCAACGAGIKQASGSES